MKTVAIVRLTETGRRAFPISFEDAEKLVLEGQAFKHNRGLYEMKSALPSVSNDVPDAMVQPVTDNTYDTKVMQPVKRRGRPPKFNKAAF